MDEVTEVMLDQLKVLSAREAETNRSLLIYAYTLSEVSKTFTDAQEQAYRVAWNEAIKRLDASED